MAFTELYQLNVTSSAFAENGMIPKKYTCDGEEVSPPLTIHNVPAAAKSVALIVHDPDAPHPGGMVHWVAWNLPLGGEIPEGYKGGKQGQNGKDKKGYMGMCPPEGSHQYHFYAYALDIKLELEASTDKIKLEKAMEEHIIAKGEMTGLYSKK